MPNLSDYYNENMMPNPVDSSHYYPDNIHKIRSIIDNKSFSLFHVNLRSLDAHFDELQSILSLINVPFHIIGISET